MRGYVKITTYRANGQLRFKHPLWLAVVNRRGLSLKEIRAIYLRRPVIEHFDRFIEQRLLFESAFNDFSTNQVQFALFRLSKLQQTVSCLLSTACPIGSRTVR